MRSILAQRSVWLRREIFDGYDFVAMVHMGPQTTAEVQFIALDGIGARWHGKPAHAAGEPWSGRNALNAARLFFDATDAMRQHIIPEARIHGIIKNGGEASNIVPELSEVEFLTRAPKRKDLDDITEWVKDCARAAASATRTEVEIFSLCEPFHDLYVSPLEKAAVEEGFRELGLDYAESIGMTGSFRHRKRGLSLSGIPSHYEHWQTVYLPYERVC